MAGERFAVGDVALLLALLPIVRASAQVIQREATFDDSSADRIFSAGPGRTKLVALTPRGVRRVAEARPHWQEAQDTFLDEVGRASWNGLAKQLSAIVNGRFARP